MSYTALTYIKIERIVSSLGVLAERVLKSRRLVGTGWGLPVAFLGRLLLPSLAGRLGRFLGSS